MPRILIEVEKERVKTRRARKWTPVPLILRRLRQKSKWRTQGVAWLTKGELQADALGDLATKSNKLSIYRLEDESKEALERVVAALAVANTEFISDFDYVTLDEDVISNLLGIKIDKVAGETPDRDVNSLHFDLIELTADKVLELAHAISDNAKPQRLLSKDVRGFVARGVHRGQIDRSKLKLSPVERQKLNNEIARIGRLEHRGTGLKRFLRRLGIGR